MGIISVRLPDNISTILSRLSHDSHLSVSEIVRRSIFENLKKFKGHNKKLVAEAKRMIAREDAYMKVKDLSKNAYLLKNADGRIMDMAISSYLLTNKLNMPIINKYINEIQRAYRNFEPWMKKGYKREMEVLQSYRREQVLIVRLGQRLKALNLSPIKSG